MYSELIFITKAHFRFEVRRVISIAVHRVTGDPLHSVPNALKRDQTVFTRRYSAD